MPKHSSNNVSGTVMVVGGGIGGIQAALDLADSGFYVYLVEKSSAIGGIMSQLDKTFPTNDCSMCIISPKLVEVTRHLNIELLTNTDLLALQGTAGNFEARVLQQPRFIDLEKCTSCGECAKVCPISVANEFDQSLSLRKAAFKKYPQASPAAYAITKRGTAPCKAECPAHISVQGYVALAAQGKYKEALQLIKEENPLPAICGRVCHHPCESVCTRGQLDEPVAIDFIKRFVADLDLSSDTRFVPELEETREEKIAIIGSGPAGLSCAYYLAVKGYRVAIFEKLPVAGGMLSAGIPEYRLPRETINSEIQIIRDMGVTIETGVNIGTDITIEQLRNDGYKAFFLAVGAHECKKLGIEGEDLDGVHPGIDFLRQVNMGQKVELGPRVAVVGGGNVAMDSVRTALRNGSKEAFIVYRRSFEEMPANVEEIEECEEEGIEIHTLTNPTGIIGENGKVKAIELLKMELGEPDESGRRRPVPIPDSEYVIEVDAVIPAIGQESDWACLGPECACTLTDWKTMKVDPVTLQTDDPDIFAGGDAVTGPRTVIEAIEAGKQAAVSIDRFINGMDLAHGREIDLRPVQDAPLDGRTPVPRTHMPRLAPEERTDNFKEVQLGFSEQQAKDEAQRCLECGICSECYQCVEVCLAGAVDHSQKEAERTLDVGAVILCPGASTYDPSPLEEFYLYRSHPNVVTSIEFERILSASGPCQGHLIRPSDGKEPRKIAWLQCVGSRDVNRCGNGYCSYMCCMYAIKEAVIAKEHSKDPLDTAIFFMDMRTFGKDYEKYYSRAEEEHGVRFVRSRIHSIFRIPGSDDLQIVFAGEDGTHIDEVFDMVVLSVGVKPGAQAVELAARLGVELNADNFAATSPFSPVHTSREGVYACGIFQAPKDIPSSVSDGSAAACAAGEVLARARWSDTKSLELPEEKDVTGRPPRIGVFVCNCGLNIGGVIDVPAVTEYARDLEGVVFSDANLFTCSQDTQEAIKEKITEYDLNRIVVASCSPRTHEPLFMETLQACGLNKYLFEMANIRDQNSWVHGSTPDLATEKAKDLVRMAVARAARLKPLQTQTIEVNKSALVIGGGVAGMNAALGIGNQGFEVVLIEREPRLGGLARELTATIEGADIQRYLHELIDRVMEHDKIEVLTDTLVVDAGGFQGNFTTEVMVGTGPYERRIDHGVIILATGAREYRPTEYLYGEDGRVVTQIELAQRLEKVGAGGLNQVVMIQCVGSRNDRNPNCSRVCCQTAIKNAIHIKEDNPKAHVFVLYRDMRMYGLLEHYYREARERGVLFFLYSKDDPPRVEQSSGGLKVVFRDHVLGVYLEVYPDLVTLSAGVVPEDNKELSQILKTPLNAEGYFMEAHVKLRPVEMASDGIFLCGAAHSPKLISESISQARAAASRAATFLSQDSITLSAVTARVDPDLCASCLVCVMSCPYSVPRINDEGVSEIDVALCHGCGVCVAECPAKAIALNWYEDDQIVCKLDALLEGVM